MTAPLFAIVENTVVGQHRYVRIKPSSPSTFAADLVPLLRGRYIQREAARERLKRAAGDLTMFNGQAVALTDAEIEEALQAEIDAALPASWAGGRPKQLDVRRSEFGEIVAAEVLSQLFATHLPASRIADKEVPDQQARGADIMGLENVEMDRLVLVLCEVKGSGEEASPPAVLADMEKKLRTLTTDRRALNQELIWLREHADEAHKDLCVRVCASFLVKRPIFDISITPILVREAKHSKATDAGKFRSDPDSFGHPIRWIAVEIDDDLFEIADAVFRLAAAPEVA